MKKLSLLLIVFIMAAVTVFAELKVDGEVNAIWNAFQYVQPAPLPKIIGTEIPGVGAEVPDYLFETDRAPHSLTGFGRAGGSAFEVVLNFSGQSESGRAGFYAGLFYQNGLSASGRGWLKPFDWMRIDVGKVKANDMSKLPLDYYPKLDSFMLKAGRDADIFTNYEENNSMLLRITPDDNLFLGLFLYNQALLNMGENAASRPMIGGEDPKYAFQRVQATLGYVIPDIGTARIQYRGVNPDVNDDTHFITAPRLEAAFAFTGVNDLIVDLGIKYFFLLTDPQIPARRNESAEVQGIIPIPDFPSASSGVNSLTGTTELKGSYQAPQQVSLGARYQMDLGRGSLALQGRFDSKFFGWYQPARMNIIRMGPEIKMSLWPSYRIDDWTFQVETTMVYAADWTSYGRTLYRGGLGYSCGAFVQRHIGRNSLTIGIAVSGGEGIVLPKLGASENPSSIAINDNTARVSTPWETGKLPVVFSVPIKYSIKI
jgi:hypothetical protein